MLGVLLGGRASGLLHRDADPALLRDLVGAVVARVDVPDDAHARVVRQDARELLRREVGAVGERDLAGVDASDRSPTPPPWWIDTQQAPEAVLTSALSSGQSAIASEPSAIASVSR